MKALSESYLSITCVICFLSDYFPSCLLLKLLPDRNSLKFGGGGEKKIRCIKHTHVTELPGHNPIYLQKKRQKYDNGHR